MCWPLYFTRGNRKSAPLGLGDRGRRTSSSPKIGGLSGGESYPYFEGTRHKAQGDFSKKAFYKGWDFTTACPKQQKTPLYLLAYLYKPHV